MQPRASSILDLRSILAFGSRRENDYRVVRTWLYYLRGARIAFVILLPDEVEKGLLCGRVPGNTEQQRAKYGTSHTLLFLKICYRTRNITANRRTNAASQFLFACRNGPETLHIHESKIPANRIISDY